MMDSKGDRVGKGDRILIIGDGVNCIRPVLDKKPLMVLGFGGKGKCISLIRLVKHHQITIVAYGETHGKAKEIGGVQEPNLPPASSFNGQVESHPERSDDRESTVRVDEPAYRETLTNRTRAAAVSPRLFRLTKAIDRQTTMMQFMVVCVGINFLMASIVFYMITTFRIPA